jgi:1-acyl-sn-glycerol-3-phosphate acyltransferase
MPDPGLKPQVYTDPRPSEHFDRFHERARMRDPDPLYDVARIVLTPPCLALYRSAAIGADNVPLSGPVILAPNHFSQWDHFFAGVFIRRRVRFMAKSQLFTNPVITWILHHGGAFPVRRGKHDEEAFITAYAILERGGCLLMYPEGGRSRTGGLGEPRRGVGRLALESGVPVVPVAIHGSKGVRGWKRFRFPKVTVQYGEPMSFGVVDNPTKEQQLEVARHVFDRVRAMYTALEEQGRRRVIKAVREGITPGSPADASARPQAR